MRNRILVATVLPLICLACHVCVAESGPPTRLIVLVVVDQLRGDLLPRFSPHFGTGGFARLMREGADFRNIYLSYGSSSTAPGHATLATGRLPRDHGIVANEWWLDPELTESQHAVHDPNTVLVGLPDGRRRTGASPWRLKGSTLADELKLADARSRVFSVSLKDRAAVMLGGKRPDGVYWWDTSSGRYISSTWYTRELPAHVAAFNAEGVADRLLGQHWDLLLPEEAYGGCQPLEPSWVLDDFGLGRSFPHSLHDQGGAGTQFYKSVVPTPFGNDLVMDVVGRLVENERLGGRGATDLLCISFSSNDYCGHLFGPDSREVLDMTVRTDRQVETLLAMLERHVGLDRCLIALTSDHGVKSIPDLARTRGLGGGRLPAQAELSRQLSEVLQSAAGPLPGGRPYVLGIEMPWVYMHPSLHELEPTLRAKLLGIARNYLLHIEGVADVYTSEELSGPQPGDDDLNRRLAWRSYCKGRSGELYVHEEPYYYDEPDKATGHGTTSSHDRHVTLLLRGAGVRPGRYFAPADLMDVPVTLAALVGIEKPLDAVGRVLHEALQSAP